MSGGSYEYICHADLEDLLHKQEHVQRMADRLAELGYAQDAAKETQELLLTLRQFENRINAMQGRLQRVWRSVEWWDSSDTTEDGVKMALDEYRDDA